MSQWRSVAYVESPLQLINVVEAHHAGTLGTHTDLIVRDPHGTIAPTISALKTLGTPSGIKWYGTKDTPGATPHNLATGNYTHVLGDPFSGQQQSGLLRHTRLDHVVIVDDGLNTLAALEALAGNKAMTRPGHNVSPARKALGLATTHALRKVAFAGKLRLFTAMPPTERLLHDLAIIDAHGTFHHFPWLTAQQQTEPIPEPNIIVGSGFVADGHIHAEHYLDWLTTIAQDGDSLYLPHRRTSAPLLYTIEHIPGLRVEPQQACVEIVTRSLRAPQKVTLLPTTALLTLTPMLTRHGVTINPRPIPQHWWTSETSPDVQNFLSRPIDLYESLRT